MIKRGRRRPSSAARAGWRSPSISAFHIASPLAPLMPGSSGCVRTKGRSCCGRAATSACSSRSRLGCGLPPGRASRSSRGLQTTGRRKSCSPTAAAAGRARSRSLTRRAGTSPRSGGRARAACSSPSTRTRSATATGVNATWSSRAAATQRRVRRACRARLLPDAWAAAPRSPDLAAPSLRARAGALALSALAGRDRAARLPRPVHLDPRGPRRGTGAPHRSMAARPRVGAGADPRRRDARRGSQRSSRSLELERGLGLRSSWNFVPRRYEVDDGSCPRSGRGRLRGGSARPVSRRPRSRVAGAHAGATAGDARGRRALGRRRLPLAGDAARSGS